MATLLVRNIPDEVVRLLDQRAAVAGRSREAEIRTILADSTRDAAGWNGFLTAAEFARSHLPPIRPLTDSVADLAAARAERSGEAS